MNTRNVSYPVPLGTGFPIHRGLLGLLIFLCTEAMFFAGLISTFLILRAGSGIWPPAEQPRLPVAMTGANTLLLLVSGYTVIRAVRAIRGDQVRECTGWLLVTGVLGSLFMAVQGYEWANLLRFGLSITSSNYGATFYTLIGAHSLHVLVALIALLLVLVKAATGQYSRSDHTGIVLCQTYWLFVVAVWPVLYLLVYVW